MAAFKPAPVEARRYLDRALLGTSDMGHFVLVMVSIFPQSRLLDRPQLQLDSKSPRRRCSTNTCPPYGKRLDPTGASPPGSSEGRRKPIELFQTSSPVLVVLLWTAVALLGLALFLLLILMIPPLHVKGRVDSLDIDEENPFGLERAFVFEPMSSAFWSARLSIQQSAGAGTTTSQLYLFGFAKTLESSSPTGKAKRRRQEGDEQRRSISPGANDTTMSPLAAENSASRQRPRPQKEPSSPCHSCDGFGPRRHG